MRAWPLAALLACASPALACSVVPGYRIPTNLELVADAELIVLGRVVAGDEAAQEHLGRLRVDQIETLKGAMPGGPIAIEGARVVAAGQVDLSNPHELADAHPDSFTGACIRRNFARGTTVLFFLRRGPDGRWHPAGEPFSRWAEDVPIEGAPWPRLVRFYAEVAAAPAHRRRAMLKAERDRLLAGADDPVNALLAAEIARQIVRLPAPH